MGLRYSDFKSITFVTADSTPYKIGTDSGKEFLSVSTLFLADQDCWVKYNHDTTYNKIYANDYFTSERKIFMITVKRVDTNGTLDVWAEGNSDR